MAEATTLRVVGATKVFPGVRALDDVSIEVHGGEILGLVGENGAGKSTLLGVLAGRVSADDGTITLDGEEQRFGAPAAAIKSGIELVPQEVAIVPDLSVAENISLESYRRGLLRPVRWKPHRERATEVMERVHLTCRPDEYVGDLALADQRLVMIARALYRGSRVLIMDEPTVGLPADEVERILGVAKKLRDAGVALIYCSHALEEIERLADRVVVMRDGRVVGRFDRGGTDRDGLVRTIIGGELPEIPRKEVKTGRPTLLSVKGLTTDVVDGVSLELAEGEILGLAGLVGSGRTEIVRAIAGADSRNGGEMTLGGARYDPSNPRQAVGKGVVLVPEDRRRQGLVTELSARENATLGAVKPYTTGPLLSTSRERAKIEPEMKRWRVRPPRPEIAVKLLSGGNQQKILLMRSLLANARVILLDEPTTGVDVGARAELHELIRGLAGEGRAVIVVSSDFEEVAMLADRALVIRRGRVVAEMTGDEIEPGKMLEACYREDGAGVGA